MNSLETRVGGYPSRLSQQNPTCNCPAAHTLLEAAVSGDVACMNSIIQGNEGLASALQETNEEGRNALMLAAQKGFHSIVISLLESLGTGNSEVLNKKDNGGNTAVILASAANYSATVSALIQRGARCDISNNDGHTALHVAAKHGHLATIMTLYEESEEVPNLVYFIDTPRQRDHVLDLAAINGHQEAMELLLRLGEAAERNGWYNNNWETMGYRFPSMAERFFLAAVRGGYSSCAKDMMEVQPVAHPIQTTGFADRGALHYAVWGGQVAMLQYLLQREYRFGSFNIDKEDTLGMTPLCLAVQQQSVECIKLLLEHGARTDIGHHADGPPLHLAVKYDCIEAIGILSRHGADMNLVGGRKKLPPLFLACRQRKAAMARALLAAGADVNMTARDSESGILCTALQEATTTRYMPCVEVLLEHKAAVEVKDGHGWTPLYTALMNRAEDVALKLLDHGAVCTARAEDGSSVLHAAVASTSLRALQRLLKAGADVNAADNSGNTTLLRAMGPGVLKEPFTAFHESTVGEPQEASPRQVTGPLHDRRGLSDTAVKQLITMLLAAGADCEARNNKGDRAIEKAIKVNDTIAFGMLFDRLQLPPLERQQFLDEALHMAIIAGADESVKQLLTSYGADANAVSTEGFSCLHQAARRGFRRLLSTLLQAGADVLAVTPDGDTALHLATRGAYSNCTTALLTAHANVHAKNRAGMTPLHEAAAGSSFIAIQRLLEQGAAVNEQDTFGWTPLHYTSYNLSFGVSALKNPSITDEQLRYWSCGMAEYGEICAQEKAQPQKCLRLLLSYGGNPHSSALYGLSPSQLVLDLDAEPMVPLH